MAHYSWPFDNCTSDFRRKDCLRQSEAGNPKLSPKCRLCYESHGAAIRDFLEISRRRFPSLPILVIPARVQGEGAAEEIVRGIEAANHLQDRPDILVVGRGGGSMEDLWCFNDERVVRAIFASEIPVVSAVGHEIDVTLADLVADMRAATPSEAAERIVPSRDELLNQNFQRQQRLASALRRRFELAELALQSLLSRRIFTQPLEWLMLRSQEIDELTLELERATSTFWDRKERTASHGGRQARTLSPLQVLSRGYSVTTRNSDQKLIRSSNDVREGDILRTRLAEGEVLSQVTSSSSSS
ncbi:MAG: exodeoxyribonuclease VII large subunit [Pirellulales bacterium]